MGWVRLGWMAKCRGVILAYILVLVSFMFLVFDFSRCSKISGLHLHPLRVYCSVFFISFFYLRAQSALSVSSIYIICTSGISPLEKSEILTAALRISMAAIAFFCRSFEHPPNHYQSGFLTRFSVNSQTPAVQNYQDDS